MKNKSLKMVFACALLSALGTAQAQFGGFLCPSGPGPGERQIGMQPGGNGVAAIPMCVLDGSAPAPTKTDDTAERLAEEGRRRRAASAWGAIAMDSKRRMIGVASSRGSKERAEAVAVADCGQADCAVISSFKEKCGVVAVAADRQIGLGVGEDFESAARQAMAACNEKSTKICHFPTIPTCGGFYKPSSLENNRAILEAQAWDLAVLVDNRQYWGAQASNGKVFTSAIDQKDRASAERAALAACGAADCKVQMTFENSCGAIATYKIPGGHVITATASNANPYEVQLEALKQCHKTGQACGIAQLSCTGRKYLDRR